MQSHYVTTSTGTYLSENVVVVCQIYTITFGMLNILIVNDHTCDVVLAGFMGRSQHFIAYKMIKTWNLYPLRSKF